ncbi:MAG: SUMF1/EgtB/PvdO family nonheme iron enzyme [Treponema sp.]|nr:SUMF1/EgtB/PvdO family nonheme iron enzyme [Treponema sp.]
MKKIFIFTLIILIAVPAVYSQQNVSSPQKFALVIGNGNYSAFGSLQNAVNDANDISSALQNIGFTVDRVLNANRVQMVEAITRFKNALSRSRNSYGFFFYAGHAVQFNGVNFLIPATADIPNANYLGDMAISVQTMLSELNDAGNELNIIVLDACRDFPAAWSRSVSRGLNVVSNQPADSIIVYATSAGSVASDGTGRNGLFTSHLLTQLRTPGLTVREVFDRTGSAVARASNRSQIPAIYSQYFDDAYLGSRPAAPTPSPAVTVQPTPSPVVTPAPVAAVQPPAPRPSSSIVSNDLVHIQGGTFMMGVSASEAGYIRGVDTPWQVTVSSFMISRYEITNRELMGIRQPSQREYDFYTPEELNSPAVNISWIDAIEYCNMRSGIEELTPVYTIRGSGSNLTVRWNRNANGYRLPTEAEWEYACRAGTTTAYNTGSTISDNTGWYADNSGNAMHPLPVGQKPANAWGLYDMHGNATEWCWDRHGVYPTRASTDPTGASSGTYRVLRGGSISSSSIDITSSYREIDSRTYGSQYNGFRVVRNAPGVTYRPAEVR